jgi:hypothetical protein
VLGAALAVEFADELVDGAKGATLPAIQHSLGIGYAQIGLLSAVPLLVGGLLELSAGLLRNRRAGIIGGGVLFVLSLAGVAFAQNFAELLIAALNRFSDLAILRATAVAAALLYPAFLLAPELPVKIVLLAPLSAATATWYPLPRARLYGTVPSPVAVTLTTATSMAAAAGSLAVGVVAGAFGLTWALAGLAGVPVVLLLIAFAETPLSELTGVSPPARE